MSWEQVRAEWRRALDETAAAMAREIERTALPGCATAEAYVRLGSGLTAAAAADWRLALDAHTAACPACKLRMSAVQVGTASLPPFPRSWSLRVYDRVARALRVPSGDSGPGRRAGVGIGLFAAAYSLFFVFWNTMDGGWKPHPESVWMNLWTRLAVVPLCGFLGPYLVGFVFDVTRTLPSNFLKVLVRAFVGMFVGFFFLGVFMSLGDEGFRGSSFWKFPLFGATMAAICVLAASLFDLIREEKVGLGPRRPTG